MACPLNKNRLTVSSGHWEGHVYGNVRPVCRWRQSVAAPGPERRFLERTGIWAMRPSLFICYQWCDRAPL